MPTPADVESPRGGTSRPFLQGISRFYRGTALLLLNLLILTVVLESVARLFRPGPSSIIDQWAELSYYQDLSWGAEYWAEFGAAGGARYVPYTLWRRPPFSGEFVNVDGEGVRRTPGSRCDPDTFTIYTFGGSTMWGTGSPDDATIPAFLLGQLEADGLGPLCVTNFGESAWVSSQELAELVRQLRRGRRPDLVIFYGGINDTFTAYQHGFPAVHWDSTRIARRFERDGPLTQRLDDWLRDNSVFYRGLNRAVDAMSGTPRGRPAVNGVDLPSLQNAVVETYLQNVRLADALGRSFGFETLAFWQPLSLVGNKRLTEEEERAVAADADSAAVEFARGVYQLAGAAAGGIPNFTSLIDVFADTDGFIWIDWVHVNPEGNRTVARAMSPEVASAIRRIRGVSTSNPRVE